MLVLGGILLVWLVLVVLVLAALREAALADEEQARRSGQVSAHAHPRAAAALAVVAMSPCASSHVEATSADTRCEDAGTIPDLTRLRPALDATRHAADMVARGDFSHVSPGGGTMVDRLRRGRYRDAGIGMARGRPDGAGDGVVHVAEFGRRDCP